VYISQANVNVVAGAVTGPATVPTPIGGTGYTTGAYAELIGTTTTAESAADPSTGVLVVPTAATGLGLPPVANLNVVNITSTGEAVWEVTNVAPGQVTPISFAIYMTWAANTVAPGSIVTDNPSYAPTGTAAATVGTNGLPVPRFIDPNASNPETLVTFANCTTTLLFPYVLGGVAGYDTGIAFANTTKDPTTGTPGGTTGQSGSCSLYFYGSAGVPVTNPVVFPAATASPATIAPGTVGAVDIGSIAPGFDGYVIAICNFQLAHAFAYLSQFGNNFAGTQGYLGLVIQNYPVRGGVVTASSAEQLNN